MKKIEAKIVADSSSNGHRITTFLLTYPRFIHGELMTHRVFSRNSASSRAIPFEKMVKSAQEDPFIPIAWQKDHKGMQGAEYITDPKAIERLRMEWKTTALEIVEQAYFFNSGIVCRKDWEEDFKEKYGVTKQLCNRLLEPFMWHTVLVTATEFDNFFELRCPQYWLGNPMDPIKYKSRKEARKSIEDIGFAPSLPFDEWTDMDWLKMSQSGAEIHIQLLAEAMWDAMNESTPNQLNVGEWHIPFGDQMDISKLATAVRSSDSDKYFPMYAQEHSKFEQVLKDFKVKIAIARCARLSYMTFDGEIDYIKDIELHDMLLRSKHLSPFEHCARVPYNKMDEEGWTHTDSSGNLWSGNFKNWIQYRQLIENK